MLKILIIRNDKIGDFMLAWPAFALLKSQYPLAEITALVPQYTAPLAEQCEWIDRILIDEKKSDFLSGVINLSKIIQQGNYDLSISLFSETRTSLALLLAGVKLRIGPATKIAQIFLNRRLRQKRSQSAKPEYEYNLDLIKYCIHLNHHQPVNLVPPPYLKFNDDEIKALRHEIKTRHAVSGDRKLVIIHPGTGGSAINLDIEQYAELAKNLSMTNKVFFIITAGPGEIQQAKKLSEKLQDINHGLHESKTGIISFCKYINTADIFISGSTGPLHIAGALNLHTAAFYPIKRSATSLRWKTINQPENQRNFSPPTDGKCDTMEAINIAEAAQTIINELLSTYQK